MSNNMAYTDILWAKHWIMGSRTIMLKLNISYGADLFL